MAVGKLTAIIEMDATDFHAEIKRAGVVVNRFAGQVDATSSSVRRIERHITGFGAALRHSLVNLALARTALHNVWLVTGSWQKKIIDTSAELERMTYLLKGMSKAATEAGKWEDAKKDFDFIIQTAKTAPFTINEITNSFVKFRSVGLDPTDGSLRALLDGVAAFGGTNEILHRASVAIQQMAGKGVISMEELRQQLGEAVPRAIQLMAQGMGMSMGDFVKKVSEGTVEARSALGKMFAEFNLAFGGRSAMMMETMTGKISLFKTQWKLFQKEIGESSGLFENVKVQLSRLIDAVNIERSDKLAKTIGTALNALIDGLVSAVEFMIRYSKQIGIIINLTGWFLAVKLALIPVLTGVGALLKGLTSAYKATAAAVVTFRAATAGATLSVAAMSLAFGELIRVLKAAVIAMRAFMMANPVTLLATIAASVWVGVTAWSKLGDSVKRASEELSNFNKYGYATKRGLKAIDEGLTGQKSKLDGMNAEAERRGKWFEDQGWRKDGEWTDKAKTLDGGLRYEATLYQDHLKKMGELAADYYSQSIQRSEYARDLELKHVNQGTRAAESAMRVRLDGLAGLYDERLEEANKKLTEFGDKDSAAQKAAAEAKSAILRERQTAIADAYAAEKKKVDDELALLQQKGDAEGKHASRIKVLTAQSTQLAKDASAASKTALQDIQTLNDPREFLASKGGDGDDIKQSPLDIYMTNLLAKLAELEDKLEGGSGLVAKFNAKLKAGGFNEVKPPKGTTEAQVRGVLVQIEQRQAAVDALTASEERLANGTALVARWSGVATEESEQLATALENGGFDIADSRVRQFEKSLASLQATMKPEEFQKLSESAAIVLANLRTTAGQRTMMDLKEDERDLVQALARTRTEAHEEEMAQYEARIRAELETNKTLEGRETIIKQMQNNLALMQERFVQESPIGKMALEWIDATEAMREATVSWLDQSVEALVTFAETGKFAIKDLAKSILKDILRIILRAMVAKAVMSAIGLVTSGGSTPSINGLDMDLVGLAKGGVMDGGGSRSLKRYARGGIADRAQVAVFGEGDRPEAYVPLPDGRTIPVTIKGGGGTANQANVEVNVINQSGTPVAAEQRGQRFDGQKMILDVVLTAMQQPGSFRDGMRGSVR